MYNDGLNTPQGYSLAPTCPWHVGGLDPDGTLREAAAGLVWSCRALGAFPEAGAMAASPGDRHTERGADLYGKGAAEKMSRPCTTRKVRGRYLGSSQKLCKDKSLSHAK